MSQPSAFARRIVSSAVLAATLGLSGCFGLAVTGARVLNESVNKDPMASVAITSFNRRALLTGQVPTEEMRAQAEEIVRTRVPNIKDIYNEIEIKPVEDFAASARDSSLTARVKAGLVRERNVTASAIKVVTERNVVYLMGVVTHEEGQRAAIVASQVSGVSKVVTLFEYVTDAELSRILGTDRPENQKGQGK